MVTIESPPRRGIIRLQALSSSLEKDEEKMTDWQKLLAVLRKTEEEMKGKEFPEMAAKASWAAGYVSGFIEGSQ